MRVAKRTTILPNGGGEDGKSPVLVRPGTGVGFSPYHMHRQESLHGTDASEFRPERWKGTEPKSAGWGYALRWRAKEMSR